MVDFQESELHTDIREGVRRICRDFPDSYWRDLDARHEFPWDFYKALAEGGWVGIAIPAEYGGGGLASPRRRSSWRRWPPQGRP